MLKLYCIIDFKKLIFAIFAQNCKFFSKQPISFCPFLCYNAHKQADKEGTSMSATQKEIAKAAGVSCATVSRLMHSPEMVRPQLATRVYQAMRNLGLEIDGTEIRQVKQASNVLAVVSDMAYSLYSSFLVGISQMCNAKALNMVVCNSGGDLSVEQRAIDTERTLG